MFRIDESKNFFAGDVDGLAQELEDSHLLDRKEFVIELIALDGFSTLLYHLKSEFRADKEVALVAVRNDPETLLYVDPILSDDPDLMAEAAKVDGGQEDLEFDY